MVKQNPIGPSTLLTILVTLVAVARTVKHLQWSIVGISYHAS
jgi:hypothetical protein